jgi:hypothetical protein
MLTLRRPSGPGGRLKGEAYEWGHLLGSTRTEWAASGFCRRMLGLSSVGGGVTARKVAAMGCWS